MTVPNSDVMELMLQSMNIKVNIDSTQGITTAEQHKYYPELGIPWREGVNIVNGNDTIQRTFSELNFPVNTPIWVEEIDLGKEDEVAGGRYFYKLTTNFYEGNYTSSSGFFKWEYKKQIYLLEKWFYNTLDHEIQWVPSNNIINFPHTLKFKPGKALGLSIKCSDNVIINSVTTKEIKLSPVSTPEVNIILLNKIPSSLLIRLYGLREVNVMRRFHPINESIEDRAILIHPLGKEYQDRLIPPNKDFNPNFWNDPLRINNDEVLIERAILHPNLNYGFIET